MSVRLNAEPQDLTLDIAPTPLSMTPHLRIARPVTDLSLSASQYTSGLGLAELGRFLGHDGFDGVMLGLGDASYHLELTNCRAHPVQPQPSVEDLLVFYVPDSDAWSARCVSMLEAGFTEVEPYNPYWARQGRTFQDRDGYRVAIQRAAWRNMPATESECQPCP